MMFYVILIILVPISAGVFLLLQDAGFSYEVTKYAAGAVLLVPAAIAGHLLLPGPNKPVLWVVLAVSAVSLITMGCTPVIEESPA